MAISKDKKLSIISEISGLLDASKLTVFASYDGLTVAQSQELRKLAKEHGTSVKVVKNRLFKVVISQNERFKDVDTSILTGQLLYAFNKEDEVSPAKILADYAKKHPSLKPVGAIDASGMVLDQAQVQQLADLPSKDQLRGSLVGTIAAPISGFVNVLSGNMRGIINILNARANSL